MRIDLHTHTVASDGLLDAAQLIRLAGEAGVGVLAVTDHDSTESVEAAMRSGREAGVDVVAAVGVPIQMERVLAFAGGGAVGRPHVARALVEAGYVTETAEAFTKYIGRNGPAYVGRLKGHPAQAVGGLRRAGGIPVLAHPGWLGDDGMVDGLLAAGLEGSG